MVRPPPRRPPASSALVDEPRPVAVGGSSTVGVALGVGGRPRREDLAVADAPREQLLVGADGLHPPAIEEHDPLGQGDRGRPVGDDDGGALGHHRGQRVADLVLLRRVDGGGGVVEHEHAGVGQDRPGDGDALALAAREREPALAEQRVVAVREVVHEVGRHRPARRRARCARTRRPGRRTRCWPRPCRGRAGCPRRRCPRRCGGRGRGAAGGRSRRARWRRRPRRRSGRAGGRRSTCRDPVAPTSAIEEPGSMARSKPSRTGWAWS